MALTTTVITEKGGAGKTTVTLGLASAAAAAGHDVLVVDLDPQGSATHVLGLDAEHASGHLVKALDARSVGGAAEAVYMTEWGDHVHVIPAARDLREWEPSGNVRVRALKLRRALKGVAEHYKVVLVDSPPGLGLLAVNALAASDRALLVAEPSTLSIQAIEPVADLVDDVWDRYNPGLDLAGLIVNRVPPTSNEADRQYEELGRIVGRKSVWKPVIPQRVIVNQAAGDRRPIHSYGARAADVIDAFDKLYRKLLRTAPD